ncbi:hypothetical protein [Saccharolobus caldissimus]|uniref:hypothetical protein n=1 Tax=Saccharolobus caldissimus TaxID=1702097 RepID=UPI001E599AD4|nr:hypothetical protein [Saccharolobus caldissimus]
MAPIIYNQIGWKFPKGSYTSSCTVSSHMVIPLRGIRVIAFFDKLNYPLRGFACSVF